MAWLARQIRRYLSPLQAGYNAGFCLGAAAAAWHDKGFSPGVAVALSGWALFTSCTWAVGDGRPR